MDKFSSLLLAASVVFLAACGKKESPAPAAGTPPPAAQTAAGGVRVLQITGNDQMKYDINRMEVKAGETVRVVLTNAGKLPKAAMGHNWVLLKQGVDPMQFTLAAGPAQKSEYIPPDRAGDIIAHTRLTGPGEKAEITFTAPSTPGEYVYVCTFPGHFAAGMKGVFVVQ